jgi:hypothetical protein
MPHESSTGLTRAADPFDFSALLIVVRALNDGACFQQAARHHAFFCTSISSSLFLSHGSARSSSSVALRLGLDTRHSVLVSG